MSVKTFRKKPVEIQAMQWTGGPAAATPVIEWVLKNDGTARYHEETVTADEGHGAYTVPEHIAIDTLEGTVRAAVGDWVIQGVAREFYPCKPDIFEATYEPVS